MDIFIVIIAALITSGLTLFSGFGLGTFLMPIMAIFFPIELAIAITAIVHLANNLFKGFLLRQTVDKNVTLVFGLPAVIFAFIGAYLMGNLLLINATIEYVIWEHQINVNAVHFIVGGIIIFFVMFEFLPIVKKLNIDLKWLPLGGALSGLLGGISGHQGALRSLFLLNLGLSKEVFIATGAMIAILVDISRLFIYGVTFNHQLNMIPWGLTISACIAAFLGSYIGKKYIKKVTINPIRNFVALLLVIIGIGMMLGIL